MGRRVSWVLFLGVLGLVGCNNGDDDPDTDTDKDADLSEVGTEALNEDLAAVGPDWISEFDQQGVKIDTTNAAEVLVTGNISSGHLFIAERGAADLWVVDRNGVNPMGGYCVDESTNPCNSKGTCTVSDCSRPDHFLSPGLRPLEGDVFTDLAGTSGTFAAVYALTGSSGDGLSVYDTYIGTSNDYDPDDSDSYHNEVGAWSLGGGGWSSLQVNLAQSRLYLGHADRLGYVDIPLDQGSASVDPEQTLALTDAIQPQSLRMSTADDAVFALSASGRGVVRISADLTGDAQTFEWPDQYGVAEDLAVLPGTEWVIASFGAASESQVAVDGATGEMLAIGVPGVVSMSADHPGEMLYLLSADGGKTLAALTVNDGEPVRVEETVELDASAFEIRHYGVGHQLLVFGEGATAVTATLYDADHLLKTHVEEDWKVDLFVASFIESPKSKEINTDFSSNGGECNTGNGLDKGCCSLDLVTQRMEANRQWFSKEVFSKTPTPVITVAVLPGFPVQARNCLADSKAKNQVLGLNALKELWEYQEAGFDLGFFLHTDPTAAEVNTLGYCPDRCSALECRSGTCPVESQKEYADWLQQLTDGFNLDDLGVQKIGSSNVDLSQYSVELNYMVGTHANATSVKSFGGNWVEVNGMIDTRPNEAGLQPYKTVHFANGGAYEGITHSGDTRFKEQAPWLLSRWTSVWPMHPDNWEETYTGSGEPTLYLPGNTNAHFKIEGVVQSGLMANTACSLGLCGAQTSTFDMAILYRWLRFQIATGQADRVKTWYWHLPNLGSPSNWSLVENHMDCDGEQCELAWIDDVDQNFIQKGLVQWTKPAEIHDRWLDWCAVNGNPEECGS